MKTNPEAYAFVQNGNQKGITIREHFASLAMQGIAANNKHSLSPEDLAKWSVSCADELIKQLNQS